MTVPLAVHGLSRSFGELEALQGFELELAGGGAGALVVTGSALDAEAFGRRDLDVVDVGAAPDRLEQRVREPERQQVLDRLLAEVVIDAEDLRLLEDAQHVGVERASRREVVSERLFDDDPGLGTVDTVKSCRAELADDERKELGRRRQVEHAVEREAGPLVELLERSRDFSIDGAVVERPGYVPHLVDDAAESVGVRRAARESLDRLTRHLTKLHVVLLGASHADQLEALGQRSFVREVVDGGEELPASEVSGRPEHDERRRSHREPLEPLGHRIRCVELVLGEKAHEARDAVVVVAVDCLGDTVRVPADRRSAPRRWRRQRSPFTARC